VIINNSFSHLDYSKTKITAFKNFILIFKILLLEFHKTTRKKDFIKKIRSYALQISFSIIRAKTIKEQIKKDRLDESQFYSFWMNDGAMIFSILKIKKIIPDFFFRVHGFDLYEERYENGYIPFRYTNMKYCKNIYTVSEAGFEYLKSKNLFRHKVRLSKLGSTDHGENLFDNKSDQVVIVSCSNIIEIKRVDLIPEILNKVIVPVRWIHFGNGDKMNLVQERVLKLENNITVELMGEVLNNDVLEYYKKNHINLFIHLSTTEGGVPLALQEAASFGIPLMGTNAGGIPEIVNEKTGILIPVDFDIKKISEIINTFPESNYNSLEFRKGVREFWKENFEAEKNYQDFYNQVTSS
jgi:glycosyltransferase involved in cell wall biosynthesis